MKRLSKILFVTFLLLMLPVISHAACNIIIDSEQLLCFDANGTLVEPFVFEGTTYVPVRAIAQAFDTTVSWDQETKTVHLGEAGGSPQANDEINIYYNGEEFICLDVNGNRVYPILREGTTYLPIRSIGSLFGKNIYWDNLSQTAVLTTPPSENVTQYLKESIANTASLADLKALLSVKGTISYNGVLFSSIENSSVEKYAPVGFTLSTILPDNYTDNISYLGDGNYFIVTPSTRFISDQILQETLAGQQTPTEYSSLYIYLATKGGYITDITINFYGKASYGGITLDQEFTITSQLNYPDTFTFPIIPYPDKTYAENEKPVSSAAGEAADSTLITKIIESYVDGVTAAQPKKIFELIPTADYDSTFAHKSASQMNVEINNISKKLASKYEFANGSFTLELLVYIDPATLTYTADNAAKATITINCADGDETWVEEVDIILIKRDSKWYLDISSALDLYN